MRILSKKLRMVTMEEDVHTWSHIVCSVREDVVSMVTGPVSNSFCVPVPFHLIQFLFCSDCNSVHVCSDCVGCHGNLSC